MVSSGAGALALGQPIVSRAAGELDRQAARTSTGAPDPVIAAPARRPMRSLVAMTVPDLAPAPPAAEPPPTGFPEVAATPAPWPALAGDPERAPVAHTPPTGRWPDLPDDGEQRAWAPGLANRDADRARRLDREQRGAR